MKSFKEILSEVAQPRSDDELNFKDKHEIEMMDHPESEESQHTSSKRRTKRIADYDDEEDRDVYESVKFHGKTYTHYKTFNSDREANKFLEKNVDYGVIGVKDNKVFVVRMDDLGEKKLDPVDRDALKGDFKDREDKDIDNDGDVDDSDRYLHNRRKTIKKAMKETFKSHLNKSMGKSTMEESHFEIGDEVECIKSGMTGEVVKLDDPEVGKYYTVKREDGKTMKYSPDDLKLVNDGLAESNQMASIGRKLQQMAPKEKDDMISNAMANLGDHLETYGTPFGAKNMKELEKKTGLSSKIITLLIRRAGGKQNESVELDEISKDVLGRYATKSLQRGDIAARMSKSDDDEMGRIATKRFSGVKKAVDKMAAKSGRKSSGTRTKKEVDKASASARAYRSDSGTDDQGASYERAKRGISKLRESKMKDSEVLSAAKALAKNGKDAETRSFGQGLVDFYKDNGSFTPAQVGGLQNIMKNASFQLAKESFELTENFKQGILKLDDGSSVTVKKQDADLLNQMFADLNATNKKQMMKVAMTDKDGFNEILGFAREAL